MQDETLFPLPEAPSAVEGERASVTGTSRVQFAVCNRVELLMTDLKGLIGAAQQVRVVWAFAEAQDLSSLYKQIDARDSKPGRAAIDPRILMALWLNASLDGVGPARELDRRCEEDIAYRWICGGVSVNYHTLSNSGRRTPDCLTRC